MATAGSALIAVWFMLPPQVLAHTLKVDGQVGAVLHTDPNDEPIAGTTTPFYLAFKNDSAPFDLSAYAVSATITAASDHVVHAIPAGALHATSKDTLTFPYIFPKEDVYTLVVTGVPTATATPQAAPLFTLSYDVRVDQIVASTGDYASFLQIHSLHAIIVLIGIAIGTYITVRDERKSRKLKAENAMHAYHS